MKNNKTNKIIEINDLVEIEDYTNKEKLTFIIKQSHMSYKPTFGSGENQNKIIYVTDIDSPVDLEKNIISSDSKIAQVILHKSVNSIFEYYIDDKHFKGKILSSVPFENLENK